ncbi:MAG TPA: isochorismatase family protein [Friedmanniella sp.]
MTLTTLDPTVALVVIDLQHGVVAIPAAHPVADVVRRAADLAAAFRRAGQPVVLVNVTGGAPGRTDAGGTGQAQPARPEGWDVLVDELDAQPGDHLVTKRTWGAFQGTSLDADLRALGVTQVVLAGVATSAGVESTARHAHELGYHVVLVTDAMTDRSLDAHVGSVERVFPRIGETTTTSELLEMLARDH